MVADVLPDTTVCDSLQLQVLSIDNNYFTEVDGGGTALTAGEYVSATGRIYIYADNGSCAAQDSFDLTVIPGIVADVLPDTTVCDSLQLQVLSIDNNYFTEVDGGGTALTAGEYVSTTGRIYIYADNGSCAAQDSFDLTVIPSMVADVLPDTTVCDSLQLQVLSIDNNYFTEVDGGGTALTSGEYVSATVRSISMPIMEVVRHKIVLI